MNDRLDPLDPEMYRRLYDGSQASLADMSARQAQALARVGRLRNAVVMLLRRNFAASFEHAEVTLGSRLAEVDDEVLLAYLQALVDQAASAQKLLGSLSEVLTAAGFDPSLDPESLARLLSRPAPPATQAQAAERAFGVRADETVQQRLGEMLDPGRLGDLFADVEPPTWADSTPTDGFVPSPVRPFVKPLIAPPGDGPSLGDIFTDATTPTTHGVDPSPDTGAGPHVDTDDTAGPDHFEVGDDGTPDLDEVVGLSPFDQTSDDTGHAGSGDIDPAPAADGPASPGEDGFEGSPFDEAPFDGESSFSDESFSDLDITAETDDAFPDLAELSGPAELSPVAQAAPEVPVVPAGSSSTNVAPALTPNGMSAPLRPGLPAATVPARSTRKTTKRPRTQAKRPEPGLFDKPGAAPSPVDLESDVDRRLLALALVSRPVFTADLVASGVEQAAVEDWEARMHDAAANSPVRFIHPKARHRARGSLVYPLKSDPADSSWWASCVREYRGGRVYELGVLLHRVGPELIAHEYGPNVAVLRLNTRAGLVGLVVVFDAELGDDDPVRADLAAALEGLFAERMVLVAVLSTSGSSDAVDKVAACVGALAVERSWQAACPVVASRSWEYASDRGSSATLVLGA